MLTFRLLTSASVAALCLAGGAAGVAANDLAPYQEPLLTQTASYTWKPGYDFEDGRYVRLERIPADTPIAVGVGREERDTWRPGFTLEDGRYVRMVTIQAGPAMPNMAH